MNAKRKRKKPAPGKRSLLSYPAIGMSADREDMKDVHAWLQNIRTPRYLRDNGNLSSPLAKSPHVRTSVGDKGQVIIPASLREALGIPIGDAVDVWIENNELRLSNLNARIARAQQRLRRLIGPARSLAKN